MPGFQIARKWRGLGVARPGRRAGGDKTACQPSCLDNLRGAACQDLTIVAAGGGRLGAMLGAPRCVVSRWVIGVPLTPCKSPPEPSSTERSCWKVFLLLRAPSSLWSHAEPTKALRSPKLRKTNYSPP